MVCAHPKLLSEFLRQTHDPESCSAAMCRPKHGSVSTTTAARASKQQSDSRREQHGRAKKQKTGVEVLAHWLETTLFARGGLVPCPFALDRRVCTVLVGDRLRNKLLFLIG